MNNIDQVCLVCGQVPCTCGTKFKSASIKELISGLLMLKSELGNRGYDVSTITVNNRDALEVYKELCNTKQVVFDEKAIARLTSNRNIPNQWVVRILSNNTIGDLLNSFDHASEDTCPLIAMSYYFTLVHMSSHIEKCIYSEFTNYIAKSVFQHGTFNRNVIDKSPVKTSEQVAYLHNVIQDCSDMDHQPEGLKELRAFYNWVYCEHDETLQNPTDRFNRFFMFISSICDIVPVKPENGQFINISKYVDELFYLDESILDTIKSHPVFKKPELQIVVVK